MTTEARKESRNHDIPETKKPKESEISAKISALSRDLEDAIRRVGELRKGCSEVINLCTEIQITGYEILADATTNPAKNGGAK